MQNSTIIFLAVLTVVVPVFAEPEIKGSPSELAGYLAGVPKYVTISGKSELKVQIGDALFKGRFDSRHPGLQFYRLRPEWGN